MPRDNFPGRMHRAPQATATSCRPLLPQACPASIPLPPPACVSQSPRISCSFNPFMSEQRTDALRRPTRRGGSKSKGEPWCKQRREREISPSRLRSSGLNLHNQLDVLASVEYLNRQRLILSWGGGLWEQWYIYIFPIFSFCECACVCFCVWFCLYNFAFTICPRVLSIHFVFIYYFYFCKKFFAKKIFFLNNYVLFYILITILFYFPSFYFILLYLLLSIFLFFHPFILSRVDDRLLVLQPGIRAMPLRWESQVQDTGPQETSQLHVISNGKNLPAISIWTTRPSSTQRPASYSAGHPMPNS